MCKFFVLFFCEPIFTSCFSAHNCASKHLWRQQNPDLSLLSSFISCCVFSRAFLSCVTSSTAAQCLWFNCSFLWLHNDSCSCMASHLCWHDSHLSCFSSNSPFNLLKRHTNTNKYSKCPHCNILGKGIPFICNWIGHVRASFEQTPKCKHLQAQSNSILTSSRWE